MDLNSIVEIESQVLLWLCVGVFVVLALDFLRGLFRGWRYGTYRLLAFLVLFVAAFASLGAQAGAIGGINIGQWYQGAISFTYNGNPVSANVTTAFQTINDLIVSFCKAANIGSPDAINNLANALTVSAMKWICVLLDAIIISTIGAFLVFILWHLAFKHIIPKDKRKASYKSGKLASAFEDLVIGGVILAMFLTPFTSLVNSIAHNFSSDGGESSEGTTSVNNSTYEIAKKAVDTYNDSVFSKVFFNSYTLNPDNKSFDEQLMDFFTSEAVKDSANGAKISLGGLMSDVSKIGSIVLESGVLEKENMNSLGYIAFMSSQYAPKLLEAMADSDFLTTVMPIGIDFVLSIDAIKNYVATNEGVDTSHENWADALTNLASMVRDIQDADILDVLISKDPDNPNSITFSSTAVATLFDEAHVAKFNKVLSDLDDNSWKLLNKLLQSALYKMACTSAQKVYDDAAAGSPRADTAVALFDFLPTVDCTRDGTTGYPAWDKNGDNLPDALPTSYSSIKFGEEIQSLYNVVADLNANLKKEGVSDFVDQLTTRIVAGTLASDNYVTDLLLRLPKVIESAFVGDRDDNGALKNLEEGTNKSTGTACLLDNTFLICGMPRVFNMLASTITTSLGATVNGLDATISSFKDATDTGKTRINFKNEFNAIFNIANALIAPSNDDKGIGQTFIKHISEKPGVYYNPDGSFNSINPDLLKDLQNATEGIDKSKLLSKIIPSVFTNLLKGSFSSVMGAGWLDPVFPTDGTLGKSISDLLGIFGSCSGLIRYFQSASTSLTGNSLGQALAPLADAGTGYQAQLTDLLQYAANSPILNPDTTDEGGNVVHNTNFLLLVNKALGSLGDDYKLTASDLGSNFSAYDESAAFSQCVVTLIQSGLLNTLSTVSGTSLNMASLRDVSFKSLFASVGQSKILSKVFIKILDSKVMPTIKSLSKTDLSDISFSNITDWEREGESMDALVNFASEIGDFADLAYLDSDPTCVSQLLYTLSQSQMFVKTNPDDGSKSYLFPMFFQDKFVASFGASGPAEYFCDIGTDGSTAKPFTYDKLLLDFKAVSWLTDENGEYLYYDTSKTEHKFDATKWKLECEYFEEIVRRAEYMGGIDSFQAGADVSKINPSDFDALFKAVRHSMAFGRVLTYHLFEQVLLALTNSGSSLKGANLAYLWTCNIRQREYETDCMAGVMYVILDTKYGLATSSNGVLSAGAIGIDSASPDYFLLPLLSQCAESEVFNSLPNTTDDIPDIAAYSGQTMTACEYQMYDLLQKAGFYLDQDGNVDTDKVEKQVRSLGHLSGTIETSDRQNFISTMISIETLVKEINALANPKTDSLPSYTSGSNAYDRHQALVDLGLTEYSLANKTDEEALVILANAIENDTDIANINILFSRSGAVPYLTTNRQSNLADSSPRQIWNAEAKALANVGKKLQDFLNGSDKFIIQTFDVSKYFVNEFDADVGSSSSPNSVAVAENDFYQAKIEDLLVSVNDSRLLYADLPNKMRLSLNKISDSLSSGFPALATLIRGLVTDSISTIAARTSGSTTIYPYDSHLTATPTGYHELDSLALILRTGVVLTKIPTGSTYSVARTEQSAKLGTLLANWNTAHVEPTLVSIAVTKMPTKTAYNVGDTLNTAGIVVMATYSSGAVVDVSSISTVTYAPTTLATAGTQTIVVTFGGQTTSFDVTVS